MARIISMRRQLQNDKNPATAAAVNPRGGGGGGGGGCGGGGGGGGGCGQCRAAEGRLPTGQGGRASWAWGVSAGWLWP